MISLGLGFVIGLILGSLSLCLGLRSTGNKSFWGRSYCDICQHKLHWYDLLPIFSFLSTKGSCRYCHKKISPENIIAEIVMGCLIAYTFFTIIPADFLSANIYTQILKTAELVFACFVITTFVILFITDIKTGLIPDRITYPAVVITFIYLLLLSGYRIYLTYLSLASTVLGKYLLPPNSDYLYRHALFDISPLSLGLLGALVLGLFFLVIILITRGKGMGGGDLKLGIFMGLSLGFPSSLVGLLLGFILGSIAGIYLLISRKKNFGQTIPFGPFLAVGGITAFFWGNQILQWYINTFSITGSVLK